MGSGEKPTDAEQVEGGSQQRGAEQQPETRSSSTPAGALLSREHRDTKQRQRRRQLMYICSDILLIA